MEDIKRLFRNLVITAIIYFIYGILINNKYVLLGTVSGVIITIFNLYLLSIDIKTITYIKDKNYAKRIAFTGYIKRYVIYIIYLGSLIYFLGFKYFICGVIGLLSIKINIFLLVFFKKIKFIKNRKI